MTTKTLQKSRTTTPLVDDALLTEKVRFVVPSGCFEWTGAKNSWGYGVVGRWRGGSDGGTEKYAVHRYVYERTCGPIPKGMVIDHLCSNRLCVNVNHMEVVSHSENVTRGQRKRWDEWREENGRPKKVRS